MTALFFVVWLVPYRYLWGVPKRFILFGFVFVLIPYMHDFKLGPTYQLAGLALSAGAIQLLRGHMRPSSAVWRFAVPLLLLSVLVLVAGFGIRTCGIDFRFAVKWAGDHFETLWAPIFIAAILKYFLGMILLALYVWGEEERKLWDAATWLVMGAQSIEYW